MWKGGNSTIVSARANPSFFVSSDGLFFSLIVAVVCILVLAAAVVLIRAILLLPFSYIIFVGKSK